MTEPGYKEARHELIPHRPEPTPPTGGVGFGATGNDLRQAFSVPLLDMQPGGRAAGQPATREDQ